MLLVGYDRWSRCRAGFSNTAVFDCLVCSEPILLDRHAVAHDGSVTPEATCTACGWSGFVQLVDWTVVLPTVAA